MGIGRALVVCDQWLGSNGYAGMKALRRAGWSVTVVPEWEYVPVKWQGTLMRAVGRAVRPFAVKEFNAALDEASAALKPSLLLVFKGTFVRPETISQIRSRGARAYCFYPDVSTRVHGPYIPRALPRYDLVLTTKSFGVRDMQELGVRSARVILHAFDPDLHRPAELTEDERRDYECDVSFIGTWSPKKEQVLAGLRDAMSDVSLRIWGAQWNKAQSQSLRSAIQGRPAHGLEYVKAIAGSKINLCILSEQRVGASSGDRITGRTFHIPASGGFMLHERTDELLQIFTEDVNVACYRDTSELATKIRLYLDRPELRAGIADAGRQLVESAHSWDHRIKEILAYHEGRQ